ncbi:MAG TPA: phosphate ABC transporter permease subunit PstC [Terriglobales bacterium]|nr:phosphate ABC transporter permease subunit PstC [Terriglobales bacterium]
MSRLVRDASRRAATPRRRFGDAVFAWIARALAAVAPLLIVGIGWQLVRGSALTRHAFGWRFLSSSAWDPVFSHFGAWPFLFGTLVTTAVALILAVPLSIAVAIFLVEQAPFWLRGPVGYLVELLAAVPSVVYGLWGIFVLAPWLQRNAEPWLAARLGWLPLFRGPAYGVGFLAAGLILAVMIAPYIIGISREVIAAVPRAYRDGAYALAATHWDAIWGVVLPAARTGIWGGVMLGMGRALGETMAVTMVIGNRPAVSASLFAPGYTLASVIANEFTEATTAMYVSALLEIGLVLFAITLLVNIVARVMVWRAERRWGGRAA